MNNNGDIPGLLFLNMGSHPPEIRASSIELD